MAIKIIFVDVAFLNCFPTVNKEILFLCLIMDFRLFPAINVVQMIVYLYCTYIDTFHQHGRYLFLIYIPILFYIHDNFILLVSAT